MLRKIHIRINQYRRKHNIKTYNIETYNIEIHIIVWYNIETYNIEIHIIVWYNIVWYNIVRYIDGSEYSSGPEAGSGKKIEKVFWKKDRKSFLEK